MDLTLASHNMQPALRFFPVDRGNAETREGCEFRRRMRLGLNDKSFALKAREDNGQSGIPTLCV